MRTIFGLVALAVLAGALYVGGMFAGFYGQHEGPGVVTRASLPGDVVAERTSKRTDAASGIGAEEPKQVLFGDLHVHTTFSTDAFLWSLPMMQGDGAHPIADACDYARFCSGLDFWSINDHAEASTPRRWSETVDTIRQCNAVAGDPENPDVAVFLGWEWSQVGRFPEDHYGHKNVVLRDLDDGKIPTRAIGAAGIATDGLRGSVGRMSPMAGLADFPNRQRYWNFIEFMGEVKDVPHCPAGVPSPDLPATCYESAATPGDLFQKLDEWGHEAMVIPHGNTWGFYSPPGITWDKQLTQEHRGSERQFLIEIMSGHGNSEEYRDWRAVEVHEGDFPTCPEPTPGYLPMCWRVGELAEERCLRNGGDASACAERAADGRQRAAVIGVTASLLVPDAEVEEWLDAGQCPDCFQPSFNYRPGGSTQYALAISNFDDPEDPARFRFGVLASSDIHTARPGTGYKEFDRLRTTEAKGPRDETWRQRVLAPRLETDVWQYELEDSETFQREIGKLGFLALEAERQASFFMTGGLAAVHSKGRGREAIWDALQRKEVYGTSGDKILLWFDQVSEDGTRVPMGGAIRSSDTPAFEVRAVGAFRQKPGCPASSTSALSAERLEWLCRGECDHPSDERKEITRIEVVRIRPQITPGERVADLVEDPWKVIECEPSGEGCAVEFDDPEFSDAARDTVYYVRAIEEPSGAVNAKNVRCEYDDEGRCAELDPCYGDHRTAASDDCLSEIEERAWSSPIFVDWAG